MTFIEAGTTVLLIVLLAQHELVRAAGGPNAESWMRALKAVIIPLALVFCVVIGRRLVGFLG
jgi:chromate transport protein ChrA